MVVLFIVKVPLVAVILPVVSNVKLFDIISNEEVLSVPTSIFNGLAPVTYLNEPVIAVTFEWASNPVKSFSVNDHAAAVVPGVLVSVYIITPCC